MIKVNKTFVLSDETTNTYKFKVLTSGIDLRKFLKNPILLRNHEGEAIGFWENIRVEKNQLLAEPVFSEGSTVATETAQKVMEGTLKAASIGIEDAVFSYDSKYKAGEAVENGIVITCVIFEASIVEFPSNENAIALYNKNNAKICLKHDLSEYVSNNLFANKNQFKMKKETLTLLQLDENSNATDVHNAVLKLVTDNGQLLDLKTMVEEERNMQIVESAINLGQITFAQAEHYKILLRRDFASTKSIIDSIPIPEGKKMLKGFKVSDLIVRRKAINLSEDIEIEEIPQDKSKWTLTHYRKHAPNELRTNSALYESLLEKEKAAKK